MINSLILGATSQFLGPGSAEKVRPVSDDNPEQKSSTVSLKGGRRYSHLSSIELAERFDEIQAELLQIETLTNDPDLQAKGNQREDPRLAMQALTTQNGLHEIAKEHRNLATAILLELKIRKVIPLI